MGERERGLERERQRDASSEVEWSACTCHGQSNNSINLLHKSMRYWQYDDEADWLNGSTSDERRATSVVLSAVVVHDHHRWLALCRNCRGKNLNSPTWLWLKSIKWKCCTQSQFESKSKMKFEPRLKLSVFGLWPTANATSTEQTMPGMFLLYLAESIIILCSLKLITFPWPMIYASNTLSASSPIDELVVHDGNETEMEVVCLQWSASSSLESQSQNANLLQHIGVAELPQKCASKGSSPLDYPFDDTL